MPNSDAQSLRPVLLTGAAGRVGAAVADGLSRHFPLRLTDIAPLPATMSRWRGSFAPGDLRDPAFSARITEKASAIVHLAGDPRPEAPWPDLIQANVQATAALFDAALANGVPKIVHASSVHVVGAYNDPSRWPVAPTLPPRPCCRYGISKATGELIADAYARSRPGASVVVLRLPLIADQPRWIAEHRAWLAVPDLVQLIVAALRHNVRHGVYFASSVTSDPRFDDAATRRDLEFSPTVAADAATLGATPPDYAANCTLWQRPG